LIRFTAAANIFQTRGRDHRQQISDCRSPPVNRAGPQVLDAVSNGTVEMGNTALYYY
jgi:TRAP-type mannitol/chloroaromatic compound transport system substrate-binding protein